MQLLTGDLKGESVVAENGLGDTPVSQKYAKGDKLALTGFRDADGKLVFLLTTISEEVS